MIFFMYFKHIKTTIDKCNHLTITTVSHSKEASIGKNDKHVCKGTEAEAHLSQLPHTDVIMTTKIQTIYAINSSSKSVLSPLRSSAAGA